jgi:hypothetical protein
LHRCRVTGENASAVSEVDESNAWNKLCCELKLKKKKLNTLNTFGVALSKQIKTEQIEYFLSGFWKAN